MNNNEFMTELCRRTEKTNREAGGLVNALVEELVQRLEDEDTVAVHGFGTFGVRKRMERVLVNPSTKQRMLVPPKMVVTFKASPVWKDMLKGGEE